jgi:citrate lyase subunit alpha/citrate CoA-transferase
VAPLIRGRTSTLTEKVITVVTPGESVDAFVSDRGIAINPRRKDLIEHFKDYRLPFYTMKELLDKAERLVGKPDPIEFTDKIVGLVEYRDGTIIDTVRQVKALD